MLFSLPIQHVRRNKMFCIEIKVDCSWPAIFRANQSVSSKSEQFGGTSNVAIQRFSRKDFVWTHGRLSLEIVFFLIFMKMFSNRIASGNRLTKH